MINSASRNRELFRDSRSRVLRCLFQARGGQTRKSMASNVTFIRGEWLNQIQLYKTGYTIHGGGWASGRTSFSYIKLVIRYKLEADAVFLSRIG